jgi:hypothetical protein
MIRFHRDPESARAALGELARLLEEAPEDSADGLCLEIGCGDLESLLRRWESELWDEVERLARSSARFRRALRSVWAYDSPKSDERDALLWELGEWRQFHLDAVVFPERLAEPDTDLGWRAIRPPGDIDYSELARLLRSMADWADQAAARPQTSGHPPGLAPQAPETTGSDPLWRADAPECRAR